LSETFTAEQRGHLAERCRGYARDIVELTASSAKATSGS
jgi:hypothetical protein